MARNGFKFEVQGVKEVLAALDSIPVEFESAARRPFLQAADRVRNDARRRILAAQSPPLSRWHSTGRGKNRVTRSRGAQRLPLWTTNSMESRSIITKPSRKGAGAVIIEKSGAAVVFDVAGKGGSNSTFVQNIWDRYGPPPRGLYASADSMLEREAKEAAEKAARALVRAINKKISGR